MKFKQRNFTRLKVDIVVEVRDKGYVAYVKDLLGFVSTGETPREAVENLKELINNYLDFESNSFISFANKATLNIAG
ncbi:MAG: type II toxin-antitoxin system HicB family antitoxin [Candidatus Altiarchaeota archaeon]